MIHGTTGGEISAKAHGRDFLRFAREAIVIALLGEHLLGIPAGDHGSGARRARIRNSKARKQCSEERKSGRPRQRRSLRRDCDALPVNRSPR